MEKIGISGPASRDARARVASAWAASEVLEARWAYLVEGWQVEINPWLVGIRCLLNRASPQHTPTFFR
jgi:hypothetical protein